MSIEQMVRDLLCQAVKDGLIKVADGGNANDFSSGDVMACANMLSEWLHRAQKAGEQMRDERWRRAVGHPLEQAEACAVDPMDDFKTRHLQALAESAGYGSSHGSGSGSGCGCRLP